MKILSQFIRTGSTELRYVLLFTASIVLVIWQYFGMSTMLDVVPEISAKIAPVDHSDQVDGGISKNKLIIEPDHVGFDCETIPSNTWAFCGIDIPLGAEGMSGIDLGRFDTMNIEVDFESSEDDTLLIYMLNEEVTSLGDVVLKTNLRTVNPTTGTNVFSLPTNQFSVPSWWLFKNRASVPDPAPAIDNVLALRVTTGDNYMPRKVRVTVNKLSFHGKWISSDDLYLALLIAWLLLFSMHVLDNMRVLSERFSESRQQNEELMELNRFLSIQKDQYESMAKHDKLTGALNRAGVRDILEQVINDFKAKGTHCALLAIDIDHFKDINDDYGHDIGDTVLKNLTSFIRSHTRDRDTFVRWGGEEFMLICPNTSLRSGINLAHMLRSKIEEAELISEQRVTCSFGVAVLQDDDIKSWFKRADEALYKAKAAGRNCVMSENS